MPRTQIAAPYPIFTDTDGSPLDDGYLYIGEVSKNPETNPISVYWDPDFKFPAAQPIRTNNGYPWRMGTPALLYADSQFSITIRNKKRDLVLYAPVGFGINPQAVGGSVVKDDFVGDGSTQGYELSASPSTKLATNVFINGAYQEKDTYSILNNVITFAEAPPLNSSIEIIISESGVINSTTASLVSYQYSGVGSVETDVQSKLSESVSVKDFGAVGNGETDDSTALQNAINYACSRAQNLSGTPEIVFPSGVYKLSSAITVTSQNIRFRGLGWSVIKVAHNGDAFTFTGVPNAYTFPRNKTVFNSIVFKTEVGNTPSSILRLGTAAGASPTYINAISDVEISSCVFDGITANYVIDNNRGFGLIINACAFADTTATAILKLRQNQTEIPYWTYAVSMYATDITNVTGKAIEADGGDLTVVGCIIEGCSNGAVEVGMNASYTGAQPTNFYGCYFEANQNFHYKSNSGRVLANFTGCKFVKGLAATTRLYFASVQQAVFTNCSSPNQAPAITGGNVSFSGCNYMQSAVTGEDSFTTDRTTQNTSTANAPVVFSGSSGYGPRIYAGGPGPGGGGILLMCSHSGYPAAGNNVTQIFLISKRISGSGVDAVSLGRYENGDTSTFSFAVDANGYLTATASQAGNATYELISQSKYPAFLPG